MTRLPLSLADDAVLRRLNVRMQSPEPCLRNFGGEAVAVPLDAALLRADGAVVYPIRDGIPLLVAGEAIAVE